MCWCITKNQNVLRSLDRAEKSVQIMSQDIVYAMAASPNFAQDGVCFAARPSGLYRSEDGGQSWRLAYEQLNLSAPLATTSVVVSPDYAADHSVFAGISDGVLRSTDGG